MGWRNRGSCTAIVKLTRVRTGTGSPTLKSTPPMLMFVLTPASSRTTPPVGKLSADWEFEVKSAVPAFFA